MTQKLRLAAVGAKTSIASAASALRTDRELQIWYLGVAAYLAAMFMSGNLLGEIWHRFA